MKNEVKGRVILVPQAQTGMGKNGPWRRQTVVIEFENGRYNEKLALECNNNRAEEFGRLQQGCMATFFYDVTSREYNGRFYTTANCFDWRVEGTSAASDNDPI